MLAYIKAVAKLSNRVARPVPEKNRCPVRTTKRTTNVWKTC